MKPFTSYLQLGDRLSQIWINKCTLMLILALVKLIFFSKSLRFALENSKDYVLSNCSTIDTTLSKFVDSTPHYVGIMGNYLVDKAMVETVEASLKTLSLLVYASEEIINFVVELYLGTYVCLIVSAIDGTVEVATNTTEKLLSAVNTTVINFADDLDDGLNDISKVVNKLIDAGHKIENVFTDNDENNDDNDNEQSVSDNVSHVNLTIDALRNIKIPGSINDKLTELSKKVPDFDQVKNKTKNLISIPFKQVRKDIKSINSTKIVGDRNLFYVPEIKNGTSSSICPAIKPDIQKFYHDLDVALKYITIAFVVIMAVGAVAVLVPIAWNEYRLWSRMRSLRESYAAYEGVAESKEMATSSDLTSIETKREDNDKYDIIESYQECFHRYQTTLANFLTNMITLGGRINIRRDKVQWLAAYITSERALIVLGLGILGILICCFQLIIISVLRKHLLASSNGSSIINMSNFTSSNNDTTSYKKDLNIWSNQTNIYINETESNINTEMFGWIETTTTSLNDTVNTMVVDIDTTLAKMFNNTLLYKPMKSVVKCVIEDKLYTIEKALTWVHNEAQIKLPRINASQIQEKLKQQTQDPTSQTNKILTTLAQDMTKAITIILNKFHNLAITELLISIAILSLWLVQIPIAILIILIRS